MTDSLIRRHDIDSYFFILIITKYHLILPYKNQLLRRDKGSGFQTIKVYTGGKIEPSFSGIEVHDVAAGFLSAADDCSNLKTNHIVDLKENLRRLRKIILNPRGWVEWIWIVLEEHKIFRRQTILDCGHR